MSRGKHLQFAIERKDDHRPKGLSAYLENDWYGYRDNASEAEIWAHNRGCWAGLALGLTGLVTFSYKDRVVAVADVIDVDVIESFENDHLPSARKYIGRRVMHGKPLVGHPWVGTLCTYTGNQQPFTWQSDPDLPSSPAGGLPAGGAPEEVAACSLPMIHARQLCECFE